MEIPSKDICVQVYFPQVTKNSQTNCQCVSSQFIASKTQETHSRGNTGYVRKFQMNISDTRFLSFFFLWGVGDSNKRYGGVKNGMLYSENAKLKNM